MSGSAIEPALSEVSAWDLFDANVRVGRSGVHRELAREASDLLARMRGVFPSRLEGFLSTVRRGKEPRVTAFEGRQGRAALKANHRSLGTGNAEKVPEAPQEVHAIYARS